MDPLVLRIVSLIVFVACGGSLAAQDAPAGRHGEFDFWIGEWEVQNRFLLTEGDKVGTYEDRTTTRARITPVVGGKAILEEWAGPLHGTFMNGFSLRSWNARLEHWEILLNWTTNGDGGFGVMRGGFRHVRAQSGITSFGDGPVFHTEHSSPAGFINVVQSNA